ncbi:ATP-dependent DNA ligase, partial [Streptomyces mirabilis]|uniref:ATP-dependent DNA ligase n=1 Tax=Streptomyces mirabilis TaxID=68239 RepID=UPI0036B4B249
GHHLPAGTVLDGEAVITTEDGQISFEAAQVRAASSPTRAHRLAAQRPAHYIAFDALQLPSGDARPRPYNERRTALLNLLAELPANTPIQAVSATTDRDTALTWYNTLRDQGVEGIVAKRATSPYRAGRTGGWQKIRHAETVDADVIGYTGPQTRPRALAVRLPNGRTALTQTLSAPLAAQIAQVLVTARPAEQGRADTGEPYTRIPSGLAVVEVLAGTTRHAVVTPLRLR